jgi:hypothetical protein
VALHCLYRQRDTEIQDQLVREWPLFIYFLIAKSLSGLFYYSSAILFKNIFIIVVLGVCCDIYKSFYNIS